MKKELRISGVILLLFLIHSCKKGNDNIIRDGDGNIYTSVKIGTQIWMAENLKTTKYNDGTDIPEVTGTLEWTNLTSPGYCWYDNDIANKNLCGAFYNWYTVNTGKLCPTGWHIPTDSDLTAFIKFLGGINSAGKIKETGNIHWKNPNLGATNESGFNAIASGSRSGYDGIFYQIGEYDMWWYFNNSVSDPVYFFIIYYDSVAFNFFSASKRDGISVRCLKD
jgi:uncharacterized protein (TIGR02145 family)